ncbi:MAG: GDP-L-fucose synthase, partial [Nitrospirales bacterium]
ITIRDLANITRKAVGDESEFQWDSTKPDGTPKRKLDITRLQKLGWKAAISLEEGINLTYDWYLRQK